MDQLKFFTDGDLLDWALKNFKCSEYYVLIGTMLLILLIYQKIRQYEGSRGRLEAQQVHLSRQLQKEIRENAALTQEGYVLLEIILTVRKEAVTHFLTVSLPEKG